MKPNTAGSRTWNSFKKWWTLPRIIGAIAIILGALHYLPLPTLPIPSLVDFHTDLAPELIGIGTTLILIDWAISRQSKLERKAQLIRQLGSKYRDVTEMARIEMEHEGWLKDGSLRGAWLPYSNLKGAELKNADLREAYLWGSDLRGADLVQTDLRGATLMYSRLNKATLIGADLSGVDLWNANLSGAHLFRADLSNTSYVWADLRGADLEGADLSGAVLTDTNLSGVNLVNANLSEAELYSVNLSGANLDKNLVINPDLWEVIITESRTLRWARETNPIP